MSQYLLNEASFDLPDVLKDRTVHQFVINDKGPNEFTFVISRAEDITQTSLLEFVEYLETQLRKTLPKFQLREKRQHLLPNAVALELNYTWKNGSDWMHQRQVAVLVHGPDQHAKALLFTGTCVKEFTAHWNQVYEDMLNSLQLSVPYIPNSIPNSSPTSPQVAE